MDSAGYQSATTTTTGGAPSTVISSSDAPSFGSAATGSSWSSYDSALADHAAQAAAPGPIPEEQEEEEVPDKAAGSSANSVRPAPGTTRRSRATLVCAECKRLKLQCDRKKPHCSKCITRKVEDLCTYSEASQGKIDLVNLNNRLLAIEHKLDDAEPSRKEPSEGWTLPFAHINREKESQTLQRKTELLSEKTLLAVSRTHGATLAVHHSGSSELWFKDLNFSNSLVRGNGMHAYRTVLRPHRGQYMSMTQLDFLSRYPQLLVPDISASRARRPRLSELHMEDDPMSEEASVFSDDEDEDDVPRVEQKWIALLPPSQRTRNLLFDELAMAQRLHDAPSINVRWLRNRVESMISQVAGAVSEGAGSDEPAPTLSFYAAAAAAMAVAMQLHLQKLANKNAHDAIGAAGGGGRFYGQSVRGMAGSSSSASSNATVMGADSRARSKSPLVPTTTYSPTSTTPSPPTDELGISEDLHETLYHASALACQTHKERCGHGMYNTDFVYANILRAHYLLHFEPVTRTVSGGKNTAKGKRKADAGALSLPEGTICEDDRDAAKLPSMHPDIPHALSELVTDARQMGLDHEGDSLSNDAFTEFDREVRRRLWWEVVVLDWKVCSSMNMACFINDNDHSTALPTILDEREQYETTLTKLREVSDPACLDTIVFFKQKCTFVQMMKSLDLGQQHHGKAESNQIEDYIEIERKVAKVSEWASSVPEPLRMDSLESVLEEFSNETAEPPQPPMSSLQRPTEDFEMLVDPVSGNLRKTKRISKLTNLATRLAQICMLSLRENHTKVKLYMPLVKAMSAPKIGAGASKALAAMDHARFVIEVSQLLLPSLQYVLLANFMKCSFGHFIFDAAVVLAHIAIHAPANGPAVFASIDSAILMLTNVYNIRGFRGNLEQGRDSVRVLSALYRKAQEASESYVRRLSVGAKRKRSGGEDEAATSEIFMGTFHAPFIGAGVKCVGVRKVAGEIAEQEAHGVTHPRIVPEEFQTPDPSSGSANPAGGGAEPREKTASLAESSASSSSASKRRKVTGVSVRSRVAVNRGETENKRSSKSSRSSRRSSGAAPTTERPRADSIVSVSSPAGSAPQSVVSEPLPQQSSYSMLTAMQTSSRTPAPISTNVVRTTSSSDIHPIASPTHYMRPPSSLAHEVSPSRSSEYGVPTFESHPRVVPSHQTPATPLPPRNLPNFGGQFTQYSQQQVPSTPMFGSPTSYQPPVVGPPEAQYADSNMGMPVHSVQAAETAYHLSTSGQVSGNASFAPGNSMLGVHPEHAQSMQNPPHQQQFFHPSHPPMLYDQSTLSQSHGEQHQQWMNTSNASPPGEWPGQQHQ